MKTLINKTNPAIRITAPKIIETSLYYVLDFANDDNACETDLFKDDWTLVEEEPCKCVESDYDKGYRDGKRREKIQKLIKASAYDHLRTAVGAWRADKGDGTYFICCGFDMDHLLQAAEKEFIKSAHPRLGDSIYCRYYENDRSRSSGA